MEGRERKAPKSEVNVKKEEDGEEEGERQEQI